MASTDALPFPRKNVAYRLYFAIRSTTGTLITSWTAADTELSGDGGAFADATNEATEIGTSGCGYVDLTAAEMNFDSVVVKTTVSNANATPVTTTLYPMAALNLTQINVSNPSGDAIVATSTGSNGAGLRVTGHGSETGFIAQGGATGMGFLAQGGATSGDGAGFWAQADGLGFSTYGIGVNKVGTFFESAASYGLRAACASGDGSGVSFEGFGTGVGLRAAGGASGAGIYGVGGATTGVGILGVAQAGNQPGIAGTGHGTAAGLLATGGASGPGISGDGNGGSADINGVFSTGAITALALDATARTLLGIVGSGTASSATGNTVVVAAATGALYQAGSVIGVYGSTQAYWQWRMIVSVATDTITVDAWDVTPTGTITYQVFAGAPASSLAPPPVDVTAASIADIADGVWDEPMAGHVTAGTAGDLLADASAGGSPAAVAAAVWDALVADYQDAGSMGEALAASTATALLDLANGVETDWTVRESLRVIAGALAGLVAGADANAPVFRNLGNTKNRISATTDVYGNRLGITYDKT